MLFFDLFIYFILYIIVYIILFLLYIIFCIFYIVYFIIYYILYFIYYIDIICRYIYIYKLLCLTAKFQLLLPGSPSPSKDHHPRGALHRCSLRTESKEGNYINNNSR